MHRSAVAVRNRLRERDGPDVCFGFKVGQRSRYYHDADAGAWGKGVLLAAGSQQIVVRCADTAKSF